jgi:release factor glutamine methyltransferase
MSSSSMAHTTSGQALYEWRTWAIQLAQENDIDLEEVDWVLQSATSLSSLSLRLDLYRCEFEIPLPRSLAELTDKWQQRVTHRVPVQYLIGETPWRNFALKVSPDVLIPRPETELIIDIAQNLTAQSPLADQIQSGHWADLGTGSGAIALALAQQFPKATIHAVDISEKALAIARLNAQQNGMGDGTVFQRNRITFYIGSWLSPLNNLKGQLSAIVSNPPYIPSQTVLTLQPEVTDHEPHLALDGGPDGLDCIRTLIATSQTYLHPGGLWLIELMQGQAETVAALLTQQGYDHIAIHPDLSGIQRFVSARKAL